MTRIDADSYLAAITPPELVLGGERFTGRLLSVNQVIGLQKQFADAERSGSLEDLIAALRTFLGDMQLPATQILDRLPLAAVVQVVRDFFAGQVAGMVGTVPSPAGPVPATRPAPPTA